MSDKRDSLPHYIKVLLYRTVFTITDVHFESLAPVFLIFISLNQKQVVTGFTTQGQTVLRLTPSNSGCCEIFQRCLQLHCSLFTTSPSLQLAQTPSQTCFILFRPFDLSSQQTKGSFTSITSPWSFKRAFTNQWWRLSALTWQYLLNTNKLCEDSYGNHYFVF